MSNVLDCFSNVWFQHNISPKLPQTLFGIGSNLHEVPKDCGVFCHFFLMSLSFLSPWIPWWILPLEFSQEKIPGFCWFLSLFWWPIKKNILSLEKNPISWWTNPDSLGNLPIFNPNTISIGILELLHFCCWIVLDFLICRSFPLNSFIGVVFKPCVVLSKTAWLRTGFPQKNWLQYSPKILVSIKPLYSLVI